MTKAFVLLIVSVFLLSGCCMGQRVCKEKKDWDLAIWKCNGADNLNKNEYKNGADDWSCADYSKAK